MRKVMVLEATFTRKIDIGEAFFHQFGMDYEEFEGGTGNFSTAIVEWPDGNVETVRADRIRFLDGPEPDKAI